jgi:hypothetical protein
MVVPDEAPLPLASASVPGATSVAATRPGAPDERVHLRPYRPRPDETAQDGQPGPRPGSGDAPDPGGARGPGRGDVEPPRATCTVAQLRRFIKSRPWIPLHELRRRFGISGTDDDVTPIRVEGQTLFIGLPPAEGRLLEELLSGGDVGYELSLDPGAPIVVGVYPMRPVPRG